VEVPSRIARKSPEKQRYHHGDLRAALMAAALELIDRHGVKGFTLKDAARMAGVSVAAPYRHFADKEALIEAIRDEGFAGFDAALGASSENAETPEQRLADLGVAYVRFALGHPAHFQVMFSMAGGADAQAAAGPRGREIPTGATGYELLVEAVAALEPEATPAAQRDLVLACWSAVHGFALLHLEGALLATVGSGDAEMQLRRMLARLLERR
jgi:AcrR family transcriptional regulator